MTDSTTPPDADRARELLAEAVRDGLTPADKIAAASVYAHLAALFPDTEAVDELVAIQVHLDDAGVPADDSVAERVRWLVDLWQTEAGGNDRY